MSFADPFSFLWDELWTALENNSDFVDLVPNVNRIKLNTKFNPFKNALVENSTPQVCILPAGKQTFEESDCSGSTIVQNVHIVIVSGLRNTTKIFPAEWYVLQAIYAAMHDSDTTMYEDTWNSESIIKDITVMPSEETLIGDQESGYIGWQITIPLQVKMYFSATLLGVS
jgi:hypothetical protein